MERYGNIEAIKLLAPEFNDLSPNTKKAAMYLVMAGLWGRDIIYDQNCIYNLDIRKILEEVYLAKPETSEENFNLYTIYLCEFWANNGLHNGRTGAKAQPKFDKDWFCGVVPEVSPWFRGLREKKGEEYTNTLLRAIFDSEFLAIQTSPDLSEAANNLYGPGVTTEMAREFYKGCEYSAINSRLVLNDKGILEEETYKIGGKYGEYLKKIDELLQQAAASSTSPLLEVIKSLRQVYQEGGSKEIYDYNVRWAKSAPEQLDFIQGFTEVYLDGLGLKGTFESIVELDVRQEEQQKARTLKKIAGEYNKLSPIPDKYRSNSISSKGMNRNIVALGFGGDTYPRALSGVNLPNDPEIRATVGSKSATLVNIIEARLTEGMDNEHKALLKEFYTPAQIARRHRYFIEAWKLFVSMHELLGHGSGKLLEGVTTSSLKEHHSTIEEARADIYALYHIADSITVENKLLPSRFAYRAIYDNYLISGLFTQLNTLSDDCTEIKEAHSRNQMLIARYIWECVKDKKDILKVTYKKDRKVPYIEIKDYKAIRGIIAELLNILQEITSTGNYEAADDLIRRFVVLDRDVLKEVKEIYRTHNLPTEGAFINPIFKMDKLGIITCETTETFIEQNLRYSRDYSLLK